MARSRQSFSKRLSIWLLEYKILLGTGSLCIFLSWAIQNFQENRYRSAREKIHIQQENVAHMVDARRVWQESVYSELQQNSSVAKDSIFYFKVYNYIETSLGVLAISNEIRLDDTTKVINMNNQYSEVLKICRDAINLKDFKKVLAIANYMDRPNKFNCLGQIRAAGIKTKQRLELISNKENDANLRYLIFYCFGALLLAVEFLLKVTEKKALE